MPLSPDSPSAVPPLRHLIRAAEVTGTDGIPARLNAVSALRLFLRCCIIRAAEATGTDGIPARLNVVSALRLFLRRRLIQREEQ